jgi:hypothetical protein
MFETVTNTSQVNRDQVGEIHYSRAESESGNPTRFGPASNFSFHETLSSRYVPVDVGTSKIATTAWTMKQHSERILRELHEGDPALDTMTSNKKFLGGDSVNMNGKRGICPIVYVLAGSDRIDAEHRRALVTSPITVTTSSCSPDIFSKGTKNSASDTIMQVAGLTSFTPMLPKKRHRIESQ